MLLTCDNLMNRIVDELQAYINKYKYSGVMFRTPREDSGHTQEAAPRVYPWICPPSELGDIVNNMPSVLPTIVITIDGQNDEERDYTSVDMTFHCCVYNPSYKEMYLPMRDAGFSRVKDDYTVYNDEETSGWERELIRSCFGLMDIVQKFLRQQTFISLDGEIQRSEPSPVLDDMPSCTGSVNITAKLYNVAVRRSRAVDALL